MIIMFPKDAIIKALENSDIDPEIVAFMKTRMHSLNIAWHALVRDKLDGYGVPMTDIMRYNERVLVLIDKDGYLSLTDFTNIVRTFLKCCDTKARKLVHESIERGEIDLLEVNRRDRKVRLHKDTNIEQEMNKCEHGAK
jgi:hypothetical protein